MIAINFEDTFEPVSIENDLSQMTFNSPQADGTHPSQNPKENFIPGN